MYLSTDYPIYPNLPIPERPNMKDSRNLSITIVNSIVNSQYPTTKQICQSRKIIREKRLWIEIERMNRRENVSV